MAAKKRLMLWQLAYVYAHDAYAETGTLPRPQAIPQAVKNQYRVKAMSERTASYGLARLKEDLNIDDLTIENTGE